LAADTKKFVKKELKKGIAPSSIKKAMVSQGYDEKEVEKDLKGSRNDIRLLVFIIVAIAAALIIILLFVFKQPLNTNANVSNDNNFLAGKYTDEELLNMAVLKKDASYCEYITSDQMKMSCRTLVSAGSHQLSEIEQRDEELLNRAVLEKNPALCELVTYETTRESCKQLAQPTPVRAPDPEEELLNQAVLEKDPSKCLLIQSETLRNSCQALVS